MLVKTNSTKNKNQILDSNNLFDPNLLLLKRCEILNSGSNFLELKGTSTDSYHADYVINGVVNRMKVLSFSCEFHSTSNTGYVMIYAGKSQSESDIVYSYDEVTDLGKVDLFVPITEDYMELRFGCNGDYNSNCEVTFSNIQLKVSDDPIQTQSEVVNPSTSKQTITPDIGHLLSSVSVEPIPDSAYQYSGLSVRSTSVNSGGTSTSSVLNAGTQKYKTVVISCINAVSCVLEGSNDQNTWQEIGNTNNSTGSSSSSTNLNTNIAVYTNLKFRYYRVTLTGYDNGSRASCGMAVARSSI